MNEFLNPKIWGDHILKWFQDANKNYPGGCPACKGIRFKVCSSCGQEVNSFGDFRTYRPSQVYETVSEWREVNGTPEQITQDRKLQP